MKAIKYSKSADDMINKCMSDERFRHLSTDTARVLEKFTKIDLHTESLDEENEIDMCKALEEIKEMGRAEGKAEGKIEGREEGKIEGIAEGKEEQKKDSMLGTYIRCVESGIEEELARKISEITDDLVVIARQRLVEHRP